MSAKPVDIVRRHLDRLPFSQGERDAITHALYAGRDYGYGNVMSWLATAWTMELIETGLPEDIAREAATHGPRRKLPKAGG